MKRRTQRWGIWGALGCIGMVAFGLRVWAIIWSLPYVDHLDESATVNPTLAMLRRHDW